MEWLGALARALEGPSPWLILVAYVLGTSGWLVRALISERIVPGARYRQVCQERDRYLGWVERSSLTAAEATRLARTVTASAVEATE